MTIFMDQEIAKRLSRAHQFLQERESLLRTALEVYARRMDEAAREAEAQYQAGQADAAVKEAQDNSMISNYGYKHSARVFKDCAENANGVITELMDVLLGE